MAQTRQQKELIVLIALVLVAGLIWLYYGREIKPNSGITAGGQYTPINAQDYVVILNDLKKAQQTEYKATGRNIFVIGPMPVQQAANTAPVKPPFQNQGPQPPPPPPPAQLAMTFFGYGMLPAGGPRQAFLKEENGDEVHIVSEGDLLLNHIRILHIGNERLDFEDINTGQKGSKTLEIPSTPAS
jgi:hypothetical protein